MRRPVRGAPVGLDHRWRGVRVSDDGVCAGALRGGMSLWVRDGLCDAFCARLRYRVGGCHGGRGVCCFGRSGS